MLEDLIISRVRVKLLRLFLDNPGKIFHVREMVRQTKEEINAVRRELAHLEKCGLFSKEPRANRLYYSFRKDYPLYPNLLELIVKTGGLGGDILKHRIKLGKIKFAMFSRSFAQGKTSSSEDVDLLVVGNIVLPELAVLVRTEEARRGRELNYTVMSEEEFDFRKRQHDSFLSGILAKPRIMLIGDEESLLKI